MGSKATQDDRLTIRPLSKHEIDRRIELLVYEVAALEATGDPVDVESDDAFRPRWISAAELVRRMRPFLVFN